MIYCLIRKISALLRIEAIDNRLATVVARKLIRAGLAFSFLRLPLPWRFNIERSEQPPEREQ